ncbi:hypothetical protein B0O80DRAFT_496272 [Mortierella sp. GBAus27b]|nr:hypothetical protein BGX31_006404 [Mortierella sp. GBA43]KAI8357513.1 hypothetical protein B0O80DRAFT_496272 [Mortierella sp. GBAus27b]
MRPLTLLQKQRITLSLFFTVAVGAVFTVAAPAFVPWQVVDSKRAQALDQQRRQGKDFHVIEDRRQPASQRDGNSDTDKSESRNNYDSSSPDTVSPTPAPISSQGPIISLLTDRSKPGSTIADGSATAAEPIQEPDTDAQDPQSPAKKRRRRRKRKMVNEGWQELTGRTAREEKEKQDTQTKDDSAAVGENGGIEISWKNKPTS